MVVVVRVFAPMHDIVSNLSRRFDVGTLRNAPELQPLSLAGSAWGWAGVGGCAAGIAMVIALEGHNAGFDTFGSLLFIPVLAAAWFLGDHEAATISALAIGARLIGYTVAGVDLGTAVAEVTALGFLAFMTRLAAVGLVEGRARAAKIERDKRALELLEERERLAGRVTDTAVRGIFRITLRLQAMSTLLADEDQKAALRSAIAEADAISVEFRNSIFEREGRGKAD